MGMFSDSDDRNMKTQIEHFNQSLGTLIKIFLFEIFLTLKTLSLFCVGCSGSGHSLESLEDSSPNVHKILTNIGELFNIKLFITIIVAHYNIVIN